MTELKNEKRNRNTKYLLQFEVWKLGVSIGFIPPIFCKGDVQATAIDAIIDSKKIELTLLGLHFGIKFLG